MSQTSRPRSAHSSLDTATRSLVGLSLTPVVSRLVPLFVSLCSEILPALEKKATAAQLIQLGERFNNVASIAPSRVSARSLDRFSGCSGTAFATLC